MKRTGQLALLMITAVFFADLNPDFAAADPGDDHYQMAPDFTLSAIDGGEITLSDYKGKVVVLNFWATWCEPCKFEIPILNDLYDTYGKDDFIVIGVAINSGSKDDIEKFAKKYQIAYPVVYGSDKELGKIVYMYGNFASIPSTFFINRKGEVTNFFRGAQSKNTLETAIRSLLNSSL
ncbi:MAG: TlpA family protein disulfide reductase [Candidatus Marinimicrobia bacterium]|nr:TlpA family protein disulfide reductase [Candidatus Neomarinimicrobiota bacterium]